LLFLGHHLQLCHAFIFIHKRADTRADTRAVMINCTML